MLVVHPKDRTTSVLSTLYEGMDANMVSSNCSNKKNGAFVASCFYTRTNHATWTWLRQRAVLSRG